MTSEEAERYKNEANECLKKSEFDQAVKLYNKAIALDNNNPIYYSNRSAAWSAQSKFDNALSDAEKCLAIDKKFVKGYSRKGLALYKLGRKNEAVDCYRQGLVVDPTNAALQQALTAVTSAGGGGKAKGKQGPLMQMFEKLRASGGLFKVGTYLVLFFAYWAYQKFSRAAAPVDPPKTLDDPVSMLHRMIPLGDRTKAVHVARRAPLGLSPEGHLELATSENTVPTTSPPNSFLVFHATGLSVEEHASIFSRDGIMSTPSSTSTSSSSSAEKTKSKSKSSAEEELSVFEKSNILAVDLPCHGRSTCWLPSGEDWEEMAQKIVAAEEKTLNPDGYGMPGARVLVLSGYSPFLTRGMFDALAPSAVIWSEPNFLFKEPTNPISTIADLQRKLAGPSRSTESIPSAKDDFATLPVALLRDATMHLAHADDKRPVYTVERNVTDLILQEVINVPTLLLTAEGNKLNPKSIKATTTIAENTKWSLQKNSDWLKKVTKFLDLLAEQRLLEEQGGGVDAGVEGSAGAAGGGPSSTSRSSSGSTGGGSAEEGLSGTEGTEGAGGDGKAKDEEF